MKNFKSMSKLVILVSSAIIIVISIFTISKLSVNMNKSADTNKTAVAINGNIIDMQSTIEEALNNGDIIISGKVKSSYNYEIGNIIFTNYIVSINNKFKNNTTIDIPNEIEIRVTGGNYDGRFLPHLEAVQNLNENEKYLFILKKVYSDQPNNNFYTILGGEYQGVFKLEGKDSNEKIGKFNLNNKLEKEVIDKDINNILKKK